MTVGQGRRHCRCPRSTRAARWSWRPTTGLRPVPRGGSAPATLENHFLEGGDIGEHRVPPAGRARVVDNGSSRLGRAARHIETSFTQNT
jgi:hypothetical protein